MKVPTIIGLIVLIYLMLGLFTDIFAQSTTIIIVNEYTWSNENSTYKIIVVEEDSYYYPYLKYRQRRYLSGFKKDFYTPYYIEDKCMFSREIVNYRELHFYGD